jgi:hypothetical protein
MKRIFEDPKFDIGIVSQALSDTNTTGIYHNMAGVEKLLAVLVGGAMAEDKATELELLQATDVDATGAKGIPTTAAQEATAEITANADVAKATIALGSAVATDVVEINGIEFTMAASTSVEDREFADDDGLAECVNDATYGVEGVYATASGDTVTLITRPAGGVTISLDKTENSGIVTLATVEALAYVELDISAMDLDDGFQFIASKVTTTANTVVSVLFFKKEGYSPDQQVGASAVV